MDAEFTQFHRWDIPLSNVFLKKLKELIIGKNGALIKTKAFKEHLDAIDAKDERSYGADFKNTNTRKIYYGNQKAIDYLLANPNIQQIFVFLQQRAADLYNKKHNANIVPTQVVTDLISLLRADPTQEVDQIVHLDYGVEIGRHKVPIEYALCIPISTITEENGGTEVWPDVLLGKALDENLFLDEYSNNSLVMTSNKCSAYAFTSATYHRGLANKSKTVRDIVLLRLSPGIPCGDVNQPCTIAKHQML